MKILLILSLATLACSAKLNIYRPANDQVALRSKSLLDDFKDIKALIPQSKIADLIRRYLTGDAEFQRIIIYFGSPDVYKVGELIQRQPEIKEFYAWLKQQLLAGPANSLSGENNLLDGLFNLLSNKADEQKSLNGWKGYMEELLAIYPRKQVSNLIRDKVAANGPFAEFWRRITALRPVYERILKSEEMRKVSSRLRELGVDTKQLDRLIREDFGWAVRGASGQKKILGNLLGNINNQNQGLKKVPLKTIA